MTKKFDIYEANGMTRIYMNMIRSDRIRGYEWESGSGYITDDQIKRNHWVVVPASGI